MTRAAQRSKISLSPSNDAAGFSTEWVVLGLLALLVLLGNAAFWQQALAGRSWADWQTWRFALAVGLMLTAAQAVPVLLLANRWTTKPLLVLLVVCSTVSSHMMSRYGVVMDPSMLRNAMRTDVREATELVNLGLLGSVAIGVVVAALLWRLPLRQRPWRRALWVRGATIMGLLVLTVVALLLVFQDFGSMMRNQKELRYKITPASVIWSSIKATVDDLRVANAQREPSQPAQRLAKAEGRKPQLLVMVVGETARAMNFSLGGYARVTNPELARIQDLIYFPKTEACGTSTEVSLPCMFSAQGREDYDEDLIRRSESVLHLLDRAGLRVVWLDNQSGCKGVCLGLESRDVSNGTDPVLCPDGRCYDMALLEGLKAEIQRSGSAAPAKDTVVVLHQLGNHGPAYYKRYPENFRRFMPECTRNELRECSREEIVNAYDNAILYTDHLLASTIALLKEKQSQFDVGLIYVSDHGESLGENGVFLHGLPRAIAPKEQLAVPMLWWLGSDPKAGWGVDAACLRQRAEQAASHDNLFHSMLGLMAVQTPPYKPERDLLSSCRAR